MMRNQHKTQQYMHQCSVPEFWCTSLFCLDMHTQLVAATDVNPKRSVGIIEENAEQSGPSS